MQHDWVFDVLSDLGAYARRNGLGGLAEQLDDARHIAAIEISRTRASPAAVALGIDRHAGGVRDRV